MRKIVSVLLILISEFGFSQTTENKDTTKFISAKKAEFPGGDEAFAKEFLYMVYAYIDLNMYAVNGKFTFLFDIDEKGKTSNLQIAPKVKNDDMFRDDMQFAMKKVKTKWKPAIKDGVPVKSRYILTINFTTDHFDHGD